jgi:hypothetical protein
MVSNAAMRGFNYPTNLALLSTLLYLDIFPSRLETLLELSLRTTAANADPFKDDLRCVGQIYISMSVLSSRLP